MKKRIYLSSSVLSAMQTAPVCAEDGIRLKASDAVLKGVALKDTEQETAIQYSAQDNCILGLGKYSCAAYTVPEGTEGRYDIYLYISKGSSAMICGSMPVTVRINGGPAYIPSVPVAPCDMEQMGMEGEPTYQKDMGLFLVKADTAVSPGDTITIGGVAGSEFCFNGQYASAMPAIGDVVLFKTGETVKQGYDGTAFVEEEEEADPSDPLSGLQIAWLGSSVTYGQAAAGYSMADQIADNHRAAFAWKYAISGTTLADAATEHSMPSDGDGMNGSYVSRVKQVDKKQHFDLFIVQLSTNDATAGIPMGKISADTKLESQDVKTVIGAMEYIIAYIRKTWNCPVMFFTGTRFDSKQYKEMVNILLQLKEKWNIGVIDLWDNEEMNRIDRELYLTYMREDGIHPLREGYVKWWTPEFEKGIREYQSQVHRQMTTILSEAESGIDE